MAIPAATTWDAGAGGNDLNGGGFVAGQPGTDYSVFDAPLVNRSTGTGSNADGTFTDSGANFPTDCINNMLQINSGTDAILQTFHILARVNSTTLTLDRATLTSTGAGDITYRIGGRRKTVSSVLSNGWVNGNTLYASGNEDRSTTLTITASGVNGSGTNGRPARIIGYGTVRGDGGRFKFTAKANSIDVLTIAAAVNCNLENIEIDGESRTGVRGANFTSTSGFGKLVNWNVRDMAGIALYSSNGGSWEIYDSRVTNCGGASGEGAIHGGPGRPFRLIQNCEVHGNTRRGIGGAAAQIILDCRVYANAGGGMSTSASFLIQGNVFDGNTGDGMSIDSSGGAVILQLDRNVCTNNTGYGRNQTGNNVQNIRARNEAYYGNTTAQTNATYTTTSETGRITLTAQPFVDRANGDFTPNTTAGGGAALRGAGIVASPRSINSYADVGPVQAQPQAGNTQLIKASRIR